MHTQTDISRFDCTELLMRIVRNNDHYDLYASAVIDRDFSQVEKFCHDNYIYSLAQIATVKQDFDMEISYLEQNPTNVYNAAQHLLDTATPTSKVASYIERMYGTPEQDEELYDQWELED